MLSRLIKRAQAAYLRFRISEARKDLYVLQAELITTPFLIQDTRAYLASAIAKLQALETTP